jgi:CRP-like cAMP-binding protein
VNYFSSGKAAPCAFRIQLVPVASNALLLALPAQDLTAIADRLKPMTLSMGQPVGDVGAPIEQVVFPTSGLISVVTELSSGERIESALIGRTGALGASVMFGAKFHISTSFVQMPGEALVMRAPDFSEFTRQRDVRTLFYKHEEYLLAQSQQSVACNARHQVAERLATWLVRARDTAEQSHLQMTQEFLAQMLGVQRASVSLVAAQLQDEGLIRYRRGNIEIINEQKLIDRACECCQSVRTHYRRLFDSGRG